MLPGGIQERIGFTTGRGFRRSVDRNRARRRLREAFRQVYLSDGNPRAIAGIANLESLSLDFRELQVQVAGRLADLGLETRNERD